MLIISYLLEGGSLAAGNIVKVETTLVNELSLRATVADLGDTLVGSVLGLVEHDGGPVVGLVFLECARCTGGGGQIMDLRVHGDVQGVTTDQLVKMRSVLHAGVDQGVDSVNDQLGACESQHRVSKLGGGILR